MDEKITLETAKIFKEKGISLYNRYSYYVVLEDTYHEDYHNGNEYLAWKNGEILCTTSPPHDTRYMELAYANTQTELQKLLREDYKIHISINYIDDVFGYQAVCLSIIDNTEFYESGKCETYEDALEIGLKNALENITYNKI